RSMSYQLFTLLLAAIALAAPFAFRFRPRIAIERKLPRLATAGVPFGYRIVMRNQSPAAQRGLLLRDNFADPRPTYVQFRSAVKADWSLFRRPTLFDIWRRLIAANGSVALDERTVDELPAARALELNAEVKPQRRGVLRF